MQSQGKYLERERCDYAPVYFRIWMQRLCWDFRPPPSCACKRRLTSTMEQRLYLCMQAPPLCWDRAEWVYNTECLVALARAQPLQFNVWFFCSTPLSLRGRRVAGYRTRGHLPHRRSIQRLRLHIRGRCVCCSEGGALRKCGCLSARGGV